MADKEKPPLPRSAYESLALPVARELLNYKDPRAPKRILYKSVTFALKRAGFSNECLSKMFIVLADYAAYNLSTFSLEHLFHCDTVENTFQCLVSQNSH